MGVEDRTTKLLRRWIPVVVLINLAVGLAAFIFGWPSAPVYVLLALTLVATVIAAVLFLSSVRGIRSAEGLGFTRLRDAFAYETSTKGLRLAGILLTLAVFAVTLYVRMTETPSGLLTFFTIPLAAIYLALTRRYPADQG
jgi:carbon starvation protein CstA